MTFGEFLSMKRNEKKITVRGFASLVGISPSFLCDLESGNRAFPSKSRKYPDLLEKIISVLSLDVEEAKILKELSEESMLLGDRIPSEISEYLQRVPQAQQVLRLAKDRNISKEEWEEIAKLLEDRK